MKRDARSLSLLSSSLDRQLNAYALAAAAAGVGMLALAQPVEGKIIYTAKNIQISPGTNYYLDLNNSGTTDVTITNYSSNASILQAHPATGNFLSDFGSDSGLWVRALKKGARIDGRYKDSATAWMAQFGCSGYWCDVTNRYMGVRFQINGKAHYGWARLSVNYSPIVAKLTGYAYETIANKPIIAGETKGPDVVTVQDPSLGHLAAGAHAIPAWRGESSSK
jgi:hypothetical protein